MAASAFTASGSVNRIVHLIAAQQAQRAVPFERRWSPQSTSFSSPFLAARKTLIKHPRGAIS
jgi:hypothetical protein